jgi:hypothetical protein
VTLTARQEDLAAAYTAARVTGPPTLARVADALRRLPADQAQASPERDASRSRPPPP